MYFTWSKVLAPATRGPTGGVPSSDSFSSRSSFASVVSASSAQKNKKKLFRTDAHGWFSTQPAGHIIQKICVVFYGTERRFEPAPSVSEREANCLGSMWYHNKRGQQQPPRRKTHVNILSKKRRNDTIKPVLGEEGSVNHLNTKRTSFCKEGS